tara:strand:+ start:1246 stop:1422 length:177 start_codon:yes stop_codon:yes gene_type:complete
MICKSKIQSGYYWACLDGDWELLRYNGKWYTTDEISSFSICELVQDCVVIPVTKPLTI